jgi:hypothetical protein
MKRPIGIWTVAVLVCVLSLGAGLGAVAAAQEQQEGGAARVSGEFRDIAGNTPSNVTVKFTNTATSQVFDTLTDARGRYMRGGIPAGNYSVTLIFSGSVVYETVAVLSPGQDLVLNINFQELQAREAADAEEAAKRAAEQRAMF